MLRALMGTGVVGDVRRYKRRRKIRGVMRVSDGYSLTGSGVMSRSVMIETICLGAKLSCEDRTLLRDIEKLDVLFERSGMTRGELVGG